MLPASSAALVSPLSDHSETRLDLFSTCSIESPTSMTANSRRQNSSGTSTSRPSSTCLGCPGCGSDVPGGGPASTGLHGVLSPIQRGGLAGCLTSSDRTRDLCFTKAQVESRNHRTEQQLQSETPARAAPSAARSVESEGQTVQLDPDLAMLIDAWPALPSHVRKAIGTLAELSRRS